jgi:16S rRNA (adenine1518-N6/adenine1519-N6)-dimethyltransferase
MTSHRQTTSFLRRRFDEVGIRPDTRLGQNFLIDLNLVDLLVESAELAEQDVVLEVGTGTGSLTALMAPRAGHVVSVETDHQLHQLATEELIDAENVTLLHQDVLRNKNNIHANVIETVQTKLAHIAGGRFKLVANLPYSIATPLISNLLLTPIVPSLMVVTIQKELADRIVAVPQTKDYGSLSVWVQSVCSAEIVRVLPPTVFWPRPKVFSAIIRIEPHDVWREEIPDLPMFHQFVREMFFHRRKFLRSVMISAFKNRLKKANIDAVMARMELGPDARTEQLSVAGLKELYTCVRDELRSVGSL